jgi:hypothetical protein
MELKLGNRVWSLAERLYIHTYSWDKFLGLLNECDIQYPVELHTYYQTLDKQMNIYHFMSEPDYSFAEFMQTVSSDKYIPLLQKVVFDPKIQKTPKDDWNYYGEYIREWYPYLITLLNLAGITINYGKEQLDYKEEEEKPIIGEFISDRFGDTFLDYIRKEVNECYQNKNFLAVMFLSRKILEVVVVRVFEIVCPKIVDKQYCEDNHKLWYDLRHGKYHNFETLLDNLKKNSSKFHEDKELIIEFINHIKPLKNETNECIHRDYKMPDVIYISQWKIPYVMAIARKIFHKYCTH